TSHLHDHDTDPSSSKPRRATCRLESLATSAKRAPPSVNPEWIAALEYVWRMRTHDPLQRRNKRAVQQRKRAREHTRRGESAQAGAMSRSAEWFERRGEASALPA